MIHTFRLRGTCIEFLLAPSHLHYVHVENFSFFLSFFYNSRPAESSAIPRAFNNLNASRRANCSFPASYDYKRFISPPFRGKLNRSAPLIREISILRAPAAILQPVSGLRVFQETRVFCENRWISQDIRGEKVARNEENYWRWIICNNKDFSFQLLIRKLEYPTKKPFK